MKRYKDSFLETLPEAIAKLAIRRLKRFQKTDQAYHSGRNSPLKDAFPWGTTPEGFRFWHEIERKYYEHTTTLHDSPAS